MKSVLTLFCFLFIIHFPSFAQESITLQHNSKPGKIKSLNPVKDYTIKTLDKKTYYSNIVGTTDTTILIISWEPTGKDTSYIVPYYGKSRDTLITTPAFSQDTIAISLRNIHFIKKPWFNNRRWLEPFGHIMLGSFLGIGLLPFAAMDNGKEGVKEWAKFEALLLGISVPILFVGTRQTKYDLQKR